VNASNKFNKQLSALGANPNVPGMSENTQDNHSHHLLSGGCFSGLPMKAYVNRGMKLARMPVGGDIEGYRGANGCIVRYNKKTGEWVKAYSSGVASYMKPDAGKRYYERGLERDGGVFNDN
jgi:hypothetical protein